MRKEMAVMMLGVWVALLPFLGIPRRWDNAILLITGALIVMFGFILRKQALDRARYQSRRADTFAENAPAHDQGGVGAPDHAAR